MNKLLKFTAAPLLALLSTQASAQTTTKIEANFNVRHELGEVDSFDRPKFINFHATTGENYWDNGNAIPNLRDEILVKYDVYLGRDTGALKSMLNSVEEDPERPGYADPADIERKGAQKKAQYASKTKLHKYEDRVNLIICNQFHPFYPDGKKTNKGWALSQADTENEPYGTASGEFLGRYIKANFGKGGASGEPMPKYIEVINEPLWDIYDMPKAPKSSITKMIEFHSNVAKQVRKYAPNIPIGGYCTAFPNFEEQNFGRWNDRWKKFIDIAGKDMDYFTIHLYDFPAKGGFQRYRKGSNVEATMDMIEQYSMLALGEVKPLMISEYASQTHDFNKRWSPYRDWLRLKSTNSLMMQFMERANNINYAMPFAMLRSDWGYNAKTGQAHTARMLRKENEPQSFTGKYVFSELIKFYEQWSEVKGVRVDTKSSNQDVMVDAYVDGDKAYLILNNLDFKPVKLDLNIKGVTSSAEEIEVRHLYLDGPKKTGTPKLAVYKYNPSKPLTLGAEATMILCYDYKDDVKIKEYSKETKYYATDYLKPIEASKTLTFNINGVKTSKFGEAVLRLGVGRNHGLSLSPQVKVNGKTVSIPGNYRGDDQKDRMTFFGVLEIPVDNALLEKNNLIEITFPDGGGHLSTATMQVFNFSSDIRK